MIKIVADNKIPFLEGVLEPYAQVLYLPGAQTDHSVVKGADALITRTRTKCHANILEGSAVKMIATATIGFDHIDTLYCKNNDIKWTNAPGCNAGSVKQYIASALATLATNKKIRLKDKTIGIVGVGNVGSKIKELAEGLGMKVLLNDPPRAEKEGEKEFVSLETIVHQSDIITFHVPLQREGEYKTLHMGDESFFSKCKNEVVIINSSRGEVINNNDLLDALNNKMIANAVIDVWENEPEINRSLMDKVFIATPHIAGYSVDGKANGTAMSVQAISHHFNLPLKQWYPDNLPQPKLPIIHLNAEKMSFEDVCIKAIHHTYKILDDDSRLRLSPETFEQQRGSYPVRREFQAYKLRIKNGSTNFLAGLNKIGFKHVELI